jgi:ascorbate-specific PTS system EIIC-type component UlaA
MQEQELEKSLVTTILTILSSLLIGIGAGILVSSWLMTQNGYVQLFKTKTGTFYFEGDRIFSASELKTEDTFVGKLK